MLSRFFSTAVIWFVASALISCSSVRTKAVSLEDEGFKVPEAAVHEVRQDVYFVSNINGAPLEENNAGFLSKVSPDGEVITLHWIDGAQEGRTLNAPKGLAIVGETLYVSDINVVRKFNVFTSAEEGVIKIEGASFLNDLADAPDGTVYVSDSGTGPDPEAPRTDAIYAIAPDDSVRKVASGDHLAGPNGLLVRGGDLLMVNWVGGTLNKIADDGTVTEIVKLPKNNLDGIVEDAKGHLLISSWAGKCVYRVDAKNEVSEAIENLDAPADIAWDAKRQSLIVPWFLSGQLDLLPAP